MADKEEKAPKGGAPKGDKAGDKAPRPEKGKKTQGKGEPREPKAAKGGKGPKAPAEKKPREPEEKVTPRLRTHFDQVVRKQLSEKFGYKSPMQVPVISKIVLNMGIGEGVADRKK